MEERPAATAWAVPGSAAEPEPPPVGPEGTPGGPGAAPGPDPSDAGAPPREVAPQVALRPMTVADVLDGAFTVVKARPRRILAVTALFVAPVEVLAAWLQRNLGGAAVADVFRSADPTVVEEASGASSGFAEVMGFVLVLVVPSLALVCVAAALGHLVTGWTVGHDAPAGEMLGVVARRWWPLLGSWIVVHLAEVGGFAGCYIGAVFVMALFVVVAPVVGVEGASATGALGRSVRLIRARYWPTLGIALLMGLVSQVLAYALSALPQGLAAAVGLESGWPLLAVGGILSRLVTTPFVAAATVLLYLDLRIRLEGLDLELTARRVLDRVG